MELPGPFLRRAQQLLAIIRVETAPAASTAAPHSPAPAFPQIPSISVLSVRIVGSGRAKTNPYEIVAGKYAMEMLV